MGVVEIKNKHLKVGASTLGSELMYITTREGTEFLWNGDNSVWSFRAPVLFPICGGLKEGKYSHNGNFYSLSKHGFALYSEFEPNKLNDTAMEFVLYSSEETKKIYPFDFCFKVRYELLENKLKIYNEVKNLSEGEMYFSVGAHEGYICPEGIENYQLIFEEKETLDSFALDGDILTNKAVRVIENEKSLPLKYDYFAVDALVFKNVDFDKVTLAKLDGSKVLSVEFDKAEYFLLWTKPGAKYICLEPWCGVQDIEGSTFPIKDKEGIVTLEKDGVFTFTHTIECFL